MRGLTLTCRTGKSPQNKAGAGHSCQEGPWRSAMLKTLCAIAALIAFAGTASAQTYPTKPVTMIIPFAAGGPTDVLGRIMAQRMSEILGQQVVVENVGGAGGMTGAKRVADAAPDGYTFVLGTVGTHA